MLFGGPFDAPSPSSAGLIPAKEASLDVYLLSNHVFLVLPSRNEVRTLSCVGHFQDTGGPFPVKNKQELLKRQC